MLGTYKKSVLVGEVGGCVSPVRPRQAARAAAGYELWWLGADFPNYSHPGVDRIRSLKDAQYIPYIYTHTHAPYSIYVGR